MAPSKVDAKPLYATRRNPNRRSWGPEVAELAKVLGHDFMPWQRSVVDVGLEYRVKGERPFRHTVITSVSRQQGKSVMAAAVAAWWALKWERQEIMFLAQTRKDAADRLRNVALALTGAGVEGIKYLRGVGSEHIHFPNGSRVSVESPNITGAHGASYDLVILDESWTYDEHVLQGVLPTQAAKPDSQLWMISTMGTEGSEVWNRYVERGREAVANPTSTICYTEYAADLDAGDDPLNPAHWSRWMPAYHYTTATDVIRGDLETMKPNEFRRSYGNVTTFSDFELIPPDWWADARDQYNKPEGADMVLAFDVNSYPSGGSIAAAWPIGDDWHVELIAYEPGGDLGWMVPEVRRLIDRHKPVAVATTGGGPARAVMPPILTYCEDRAIPFHLMTVQDMGASSGLMYDKLRTGTLTHGESPALDVAAQRAVSRDSGDLWIFDRKGSRVDVSPLIAASVALWVAVDYAAKRKPLAIY